MRVLIAPDKFKQTLDAAAAAASMAEGCRRARPAAEIETLPLSDGGEGFVDALLAGVGGRVVRVPVTGPLGDRVTGAVAVLIDGRVALEVASAAGLAVLPTGRRDALRASTHGVGELLLHARSLSGGNTVLVGIGGSATTDGATGAAAAAGWRFVDADDRVLDPGGGSLSALERIHRPPVDRWPRIVAACDVLAPLVGPQGAARRYGPQKGASTDEVDRLETGLSVLARRIRSDLGIEFDAVPGAGAGGGMGAGLAAFFGARLESGFDVVAAAAGLDAAVARADLVVTGEGRLDAGSLHGKVPVGVARRAAAAGVPCIAISGEIAVDPVEAGFAAALSLTDIAGAKRALTDAAAVLADAAAIAVQRAGGRHRNAR